MLWENSSAAAAVVAHSSFAPKTGIVSFYVFVTNGVHIKDGELPGTSYEAEFRCGYSWFGKYAEYVNI